MAEAFDPYYKWLGIPPKDQPPNHYRLLGIERFEPDPQVIELAADRQMTHVRTFQTGPNSALSQRLLNELSAARLCLLNDQRKADYDKTLRAATPAPAAPQPAATPALQAQPRPQQQVPQAYPSAAVPTAGLAPSGTMPFPGGRPAQLPAMAHPQRQPAPFGGGLRPATGPVHRPQSNNTLLIAGVAIGAIVLVAFAVMIVVIMQMRPSSNEEGPSQVAARNTETKPATTANTNTNVTKPATVTPKKPSKPFAPPTPVVAAIVPSQKFTSARRNMSMRDLDAAERDLAAGLSAAIAPAEREECSRLEQILALLRAYWNAVRDGWNSLQPGELLQLGNETHTVVSVDPTSLVLRSAGKETTYTLESLTGDLAGTLAMRHLDADSPSTFLCTGAFHAMDRSGDKQQASVLWNQAANAGLNLTLLMPELKRQ